ncbi:MAG: class I mannose-6-phosphate isomerase [Selenomonadaceae bacterium]|nr:class I mannose-6-phosphate isomerase [Selenomonadaceae bacterium]
MAILKLKPACKDYLWGGRRLIEEFGVACDKKILAEAWVLSTHKDGASTIDGGETFAEYLARHGAKVLGTSCRRFRDFPILIKFIDARENLSVQVHPPDDYALAHENQLGKNEMWYVLDADENSVLYCGFKKKISRDEFVARVKNNSLVEVLNAIPARLGDVIFIPAGTIHAVGKGVLLAEIQQSSKVSYRIYDYGRGRPLHLEKALDVTNLNPVNVRGENYPHLAACDYFAVDKLTLDGKILSEGRGTVDEKTFLSVLILDGAGKISCGAEEFFYCKGDSFFLTAGAGEWKISGSCDALLTTVPDDEKNF